MKQRSLYTCIIAVTLLAACNNSDSDTTTESTTTDTNSVMSIDTAVTIPDTTGRSLQADTNKADRTRVRDGAAAPNPAKKGMKGKVSVAAPAISKSATMEADNTGVYSNVEVVPAFPGGYRGLQDYFDKNLAYPEEASAEGVEGTVNVSFVVDETGKLSSPQVIGEKMGYGLEAEALRVVNKMPTWTPGKLKGRNVKTRFNLPVRFQLY